MSRTADGKTSHDLTGALCVFLAAMFFSIGGLCIKVIPWSPLAINGARNLIASAVTGLYLRAARHRIRINRPVLIGAVSTMGTTTLFTIANKLTTAANAIVLQFTAPVFVIIFMALIFGVKPKRMEILTCGAVFLGVAVFFADGIRAGNTTGNVTAILSGMCYAGVFMMNTAKGADAVSSCFLSQLISGLIFAPLCLRETDFSRPVLATVLILGVVQVGVAYILFSIGIRRTNAVTASLIAGLEPVMNPIWVALFYGENVSLPAIVGAAIVIGAILIYNVRTAVPQSG